jgi:hypothetical protein
VSPTHNKDHHPQEIGISYSGVRRRGRGRGRSSSSSRGEKGEATSVGLVERGERRGEERGGFLVCCLNRWRLLLHCVCPCSQAGVCLHFFFLTWVGVCTAALTIGARRASSNTSRRSSHRGRGTRNRIDVWSLRNGMFLACPSCSMGSMMLHTADAGGTELADLLPIGVLAWSGAIRRHRESYTQQCTVHRSIDEYNSQLGRSWKRLSYLLLTRRGWNCGTRSRDGRRRCGGRRCSRGRVSTTEGDQWVHDESLGVLSMGVCMQCVFTGGGAHSPLPLESFFLFRPPCVSTGSANKSITINIGVKQAQQICMLWMDGYIGFSGLSSMGRTLREYLCMHSFASQRFQLFQPRAQMSLSSVIHHHTM